MARKTIRVADVVESANKALAGTFATRGQREGIAMEVESILHATDSYAGYNYLDSERNADGTLREDADTSRRFYYAPRT